MDNPDIVLYICEFLSDNSIIKFLSCSSEMYLLITKIFFKEFYKLSKVEDLPCYNNLISIIADKQILVLPTNIKNLDIQEIDLNDIVHDFPMSLEYLKLPCRFLKSSIFFPNSKLKTLYTYSHHFHTFRERVPTSVTKLILYGTDYLKAEAIPKHITHLKIMSTYTSDFCQIYSRIIPESIIYLKTHHLVDANFVKRDMTLVVRTINKDRIESLPHHPNFKVIYFE